MKLVEGKWYNLTDACGTWRVQYMGRQEEFECMVCGKGHRPHTFNHWHSDDLEDYETFAYGTEHLPKIEAVED